MISSLTARANAIKMLHSRIQLLKSYLTDLPSCYLTGATDGAATDQPPKSGFTEINHPILRSIQALINRLPLLVPADEAAFEQESLAEKSDVSLVALLGSLTAGTQELQEMGRKFGIVRDNKQRRGPRSMGTMRATDIYEDADELMGND